MINRRCRDDRVFWRCTKSRSCSGGINTEDVLSNIKDCHNHPADVVELEAQNIVSAIKGNVSKSIQPVPLLYQAEL